MLIRRLDVATLRAAWWAQGSLRRSRRQLRSRPLAGVRVEPPPRLRAEAVRGVHAVLRRRDPTCLEQALVLQRWLAAHGEPRDVVIGVRALGEFGAHAWLDGDRDGAEFAELTRLAP